MPTARQRFVSEAARLFATHGYARTSVGDVQRACGLTPGSGALYKHFASKEALLAAVVESHVEAMRAGRRWFESDLPVDVGEALRATADAVVGGVRREHLAVRVLLRDLDTFPELRERMWSQVRAEVYDPFVAWFVDVVERDQRPVADPVATATMLMASLTCLELLDALIGHTPGDLDPARYTDAWVRTARTLLTAG